jgi:AAA ATPase domain
MNDSVLKKLYNVFSPDPLPAGDPKYVNFREVRGGSDVLQLKRRIELSDKTLCQLYSGHMGGGKTTELNCLVAKLREAGYRVVYFSADSEDIETEDARYTDVLLACVRYLLQELKNDSATPLYDWLKDRWSSLQDLLGSKLEVTTELQAKLPFVFAELSSTLRVNPTARSKIRELLDAHTVTLVDALNEFICAAHPETQQLVLVVDGLDKIVRVVMDETTKRTNLQEIFVDRSEQLKRLACHVIYTVPISLAHSVNSLELENRYGRVEILPMVTIRRRGSTDLCEKGLETLRELIAKRLQVANISVEELVQPNELKRLCLMSGGHVRNLVQLVRTAVEYSDHLPLSARAVERSIAQMRETMRRAIEWHEWDQLAETHRDQHEKAYHDLLFRRLILEYRNDDEKIWHDIHPLIEEMAEFQAAFQRLQS